jgi:hypothetical protein
MTVPMLLISTPSHNHRNARWRSGAQAEDSVAAYIRSAIGLLLQVFRVARTLHADARRGALNIAQIVLRELDAERAEVLVQALQFARTGNGHDPRLLSQQPGKRDLRGCRVLPLGGGLEQVDQRDSLSASGVNRGMVFRRSPLVNSACWSILVGQKAFAKWAEGDEADPELFSVGGTSSPGRRNHREYSL